jgi:hypothetical protein
MINPIDPTLLAGLHELSATAFPKRCGTCGQVYSTVDEYIRLTSRINEQRTGLKQSHDDDGSTIVELFRNCACGSTLMDVFCDRRNYSPEGLKRRARFGELIDYLVARGLNRETARSELLKVMRGGDSTILRQVAPPKKA